MHSRSSEEFSLVRERRRFPKTIMEHSRLNENISLEHESPVAKLAFSALFSILGPSNFLFLAQIIPL